MIFIHSALISFLPFQPPFYYVLHPFLLLNILFNLTDPFIVVPFFLFFIPTCLFSLSYPTPLTSFPFWSFFSTLSFYVLVFFSSYYTLYIPSDDVTLLLDHGYLYVYNIRIQICPSKVYSSFVFICIYYNVKIC